MPYSRSLLQIQPDLITLDPEFVGSLAPPPKLTTAVNDTTDLSYARLPRIERLRVSGKADETEDGDDGAAAGSDAEGQQHRPSKAEKEKKKMRGKNKSLKRCVVVACRALAVGWVELTIVGV